MVEENCVRCGQGSGYVRRDRIANDRRQVVCRITPAGSRLLSRMDQAANDADEESMASLGDDELETFIALLDAVRLHNAERGAPKTMVRPERPEPATV